MSINEIVQTIATHALPVLLAITLHEAAHGLVAKLLGDNTAWAMGRVTINPFVHIDPVGTIAMPLILYIATAGNFLFGYAKPVPVDFSRLRNPKRDMVWVALAGPVANLLQAVVWAVIIYVLTANSAEERFFFEMAQAGLLTNLVMFAFNLFPVPPWMAGVFWSACCLCAWPSATRASSVTVFSSSWVWWCLAWSMLCGCCPS